MTILLPSFSISPTYLSNLGVVICWTDSSFSSLSFEVCKIKGKKSVIWWEGGLLIRYWPNCSGYHSADKRFWWSDRRFQISDELKKNLIESQMSCHWNSTDNASVLITFWPVKLSRISEREKKGGGNLNCLFSFTGAAIYHKNGTICHARAQPNERKHEHIGIRKRSGNANQCWAECTGPWWGRRCLRKPSKPIGHRGISRGWLEE